MENYLKKPLVPPLPIDAVLNMEQNLDMSLFSSTHAKDIEENGIPDLTGFYRCLYKWLSFAIDAHAAEDDYERIYELETAYLKETFDKNSDAPTDYCLKIFEQSDSDNLIKRVFLNQLIRDFSAGKQKAKECLKLIFSICEREKFKRMKKYSRITMRALLEDDFIPSVADDLFLLSCLPTTMDHCAAYMAMAMALDIELEPKAYISALFMNDAILDLSDGFNRNLEKARQQSNSNIEKFSQLNEEDYAYNDLDDTVEKNTIKIIKEAQLENDFLDSSLVSDIAEISYDSLIILKGAGINISKLSKKDLSYLSIIANFADYYCVNSSSMLTSLVNLLYKCENYSSDRDRITKATDPENKQSLAKKVLAASEKNFDDEAYLSEIQTLRDKIRELEYRVDKQRDLYEKEKRRSDEYSVLVENLPAMKKELHALREFAYNAAEGDLHEKAAISRDEMIRYLNSKNVLIVGGHVNWTSKLKEIFPKWRFATPKEQGTIPVPDHVDHVFVFTGCLCHSQYDRHMEVITRTKLPMSYVARVNIEDNIKEFYKTLSEES